MSNTFDTFITIVSHYNDQKLYNIYRYNISFKRDIEVDHAEF
jgi:hypothetical protein